MKRQDNKDDMASISNPADVTRDSTSPEYKGIQNSYEEPIDYLYKGTAIIPDYIGEIDLTSGDEREYVDNSYLDGICDQDNLKHHKSQKKRKMSRKGINFSTSESTETSVFSCPQTNKKAKVVNKSERADDLDKKNLNALKILQQAANQVVQNSNAIMNLLTTAVLFTLSSQNTKGC